MKEINENFFNSEINKISKGEDLLGPDEKLLWKGTPKKFSYIISKSIKTMPIAIIWLLFDGFILTAFFSTPNIGIAILPILAFFAIHLTPVWIWLGSIIKAANEMNHIEYFITNHRIFEFCGNKNKYIRTQIQIEEITEIKLKFSFMDKFLSVGDIYLTSINKNNFVLFDIPKAEFISQKLQDLRTKVLNEDEKFYNNNYECAHCGSYFEANINKCPYCGASVKTKDN